MRFTFFQEMDFTKYCCLYVLWEEKNIKVLFVSEQPQSHRQKKDLLPELALTYTDEVIQGTKLSAHIFTDKNLFTQTTVFR